MLRFAGFELDLDARELRRDGTLVALQPQVFALIAYLIEHRDRAVSKQELLDALWSDTRVTEGSLQRTVSLARAAIGEALIRTYARHGYRFVGELDVRAVDSTAIRYARVDDVHLAWTALSTGDPIVILPGWSFPMDAWRDHPRTAAFVDALSRRGRVILFDRRGVGASDPVKHAAALDVRTRDLLGVLDAASVRTPATLVGISEGGTLALSLAATHPRRVRGIVLVGSFARFTAADDHPCGWDAARIGSLEAYIERGWGAGETLLAMSPRHRDDQEFRAWAARTERRGASPGAARELLRMNESMDARALTRSVRVPCVILHHESDAVIDVENARRLDVPGAKRVLLPGDDHAFMFDDADAVLAAVDQAMQAPLQPITHSLATCLTMDGRTTIHDGPTAAIRAARPPAGIDTSEVRRDGERVEGPAVESSRALAELATPDAIMVSARSAALLYEPDIELVPHGSAFVVRRN